MMRCEWLEWLEQEPQEKDLEWALRIACSILFVAPPVVFYALLITALSPIWGLLYLWRKFKTRRFDG